MEQWGRGGTAVRGQDNTWCSVQRGMQSARCVAGSVQKLDNFPHPEIANYISDQLNLNTLCTPK